MAGPDNRGILYGLQENGVKQILPSGAEGDPRTAIFIGYDACPCRRAAGTGTSILAEDIDLPGRRRFTLPEKLHFKVRGAGGIGIISGYYPARRATVMLPAIALRSD